MTTDQPRQVREIFQKAVERVQPLTVIPENLELDRANGRIRIGESWSAVPDTGVYVIAVGKASIPMMAATERILGDSLATAIAVTKSPDEAGLERTAVYRGSHPVPDQQSIEAGRAVLEFARSIPAGAIVICLISGGGSALVEVPRPGVTLETIGDTTSELLRAGASIYELNAVRSRLSALKAGGLLGELAQTQVHNLIISDVLGDDPATIASGLTTPPREALRAEDVLDTYSLRLTLPEPGQRTIAEPDTTVVANLSMAIDAAADAASSLGYTPFVCTRSLEGEARDVAGVIAAIVADTARGRTSLSDDVAILSGGETTVTVRGSGAGGRNTECALSAALHLEGIPGVAIGFLATDGDDGTSGVAGGIVSGDTIRSDNRREATRALDQNNSFGFLDAAGAAWETGPTGTNVNDLVIGLVRSG